MEFKNTKEMEIIFGELAKEAVSDVSLTMKDKIKKEIQFEQIGTGLGKVYKPTHDFENAWKVEIPKKEGSDKYENTMHYEPSLLIHDPDNFVHGSNYWEKGDDVREGLAEIIFEGKSGDFFGEGFWTQPRNAWNSFVENMNGSFSTLLKDSFSKSGIKLQTKSYNKGKED